jgi:hypothetical protein
MQIPAIDNAATRLVPAHRRNTGKKLANCAAARIPNRKYFVGAAIRHDGIAVSSDRKPGDGSRSFTNSRRRRGRPCIERFTFIFTNGMAKAVPSGLCFSI